MNIKVGGRCALSYRAVQLERLGLTDDAMLSSFPTYVWNVLSRPSETYACNTLSFLPAELECRIFDPSPYL